MNLIHKETGFLNASIYAELAESGLVFADTSGYLLAAEIDLQLALNH